MSVPSMSRKAMIIHRTIGSLGCGGIHVMLLSPSYHGNSLATMPRGHFLDPFQPALVGKIRRFCIRFHNEIGRAWSDGFGYGRLFLFERSGR